MSKKVTLSAPFNFNVRELLDICDYFPFPVHNDFLSIVLMQVVQYRFSKFKYFILKLFIHKINVRFFLIIWKFINFLRG